jgi:hypothetical protein
MIIVYRKKIGAFFLINLIQAFALLLFAQYIRQIISTLCFKAILWMKLSEASSGELALRTYY